MEHPAIPIPGNDEVAALAASLGLRLSPEQAVLTLLHLTEVSRWNATTSLVRAATSHEVLLRHLAEGWLAALLLPLPAGPGPALRLLDVGTGGGFPAIPMRILRCDVALTMVEPKGRKAAFLRALARRFPEPRPVVAQTRLGELEQGTTWDVISFRAIRLQPADIAQHLAPGGRIIRFPSRPDSEGPAWEKAGFRRIDVRALPTSGLAVEAWSRD